MLLKANSMCVVSKKLYKVKSIYGVAIFNEFRGLIFVIFQYIWSIKFITFAVKVINGIFCLRLSCLCPV